MNQLVELLNRFRQGDELSPIVLSDALATEAVNHLKGTNYIDFYELKSTYTDGVFVFPNESGTIKIEQTRDIIEQASIKPVGEFDIFLIEGIDTLTVQAANSLLKIFEDIPPRILFLLTSSSPKEKMLDTLASRVTFLGSNEASIVLDPEMVAKIDRMFRMNDRMELLSYLYKEKLEKEAYLGILIELKNRVLSSDIRDTEIIRKIEAGIITIASTNANARGVVDEIVLAI